MISGPSAASYSESGRWMWHYSALSEAKARWEFWQVSSARDAPKRNSSSCQTWEVASLKTAEMSFIEYILLCGSRMLSMDLSMWPILQESAVPASLGCIRLPGKDRTQGLGAACRRIHQKGFIHNAICRRSILCRFRAWTGTRQVVQEFDLHSPDEDDEQ